MTIHIPKIAIVGEGVIGCSSALQLSKTIPDAKITVFHDRPFKDTCSAGPAGLFRIDFEQNTEYGRETFKWFSHLYRTTKGGDTGVKLISGHIQSDSKEKLEQQQRAYGDVVYNFRFLDDRERLDIFDNPSKHCIHYTAYCSEGNQYVPYLKSLLTKQGVEFKARTIDSFDSLADENFDIVINCAGLDGGRLAGDDDTVYPVRGVIFEVDAPWHKHFMYRDFETFTIPKTNTVVLGSVKQDNRWDLEITDEDRKSILDRYLNLHPGMREVKIVSEWSALRPMRKDIRIESAQKKSKKGKEYTVVHHYGHGSNGFTLGWGTARVATDLVHKALNLKTTL